MQFVVVEVGNEQKEKSKQILYTDYLWSRHILNTYLGRKTELKKLYLVVVLDIAGIENKEIYRPQVFLAAQDLRCALRFISLYYAFAFAARLLGSTFLWGNLYLMIFFTIILFVLEVDTLRHQSCGSSGYLKYV